MTCGSFLLLSWFLLVRVHSPAGAAPPALPDPPAPVALVSTNPVPFQYEVQGRQEKEIRDPCILREGDTYYLVFTMWPFANREEARLTLPDNGSSPGIRLYSSKDLKTWKAGNWLVKSADLPAECPYKHRFWAPEIHKIGGKFYLVFTADNWLKKEYNPAGTWGTAGYAFVGVADKVTGPYQHITYVPGGTCDMSLFGDGDGQTYALLPKYDLFIQKIDLSRLSQDKVALVGEQKKVLACKSEDIPFGISPEYLEGPWMEKIGSQYLLFYAELFRDARAPGYWTGVAYADTPWGPWKKDKRGQVFEGGHLAVFAGPQGRKWFSYRSEHADAKRGLLCLKPFDLGADGTVQVNPSDSQAIPK